MAPRPTWEGHLRLSLVACPVRLFKATGESDAAVHFNLLHRQTLNRVRQQYRDPDDGVVERRDLVRGYEIEKDRYVVVEDEELKGLKLESTKVIDIERFVAGSAIDRIYWEQPYYLVPDGKAAQEPFAVIREAMAGEGQVALGRLVMTNRERVVAVETRGKGMLLTTLRSHDEVRAEEDYFEDIPDVRVSPQMIDIARQIIAQAEGPFDPSAFHDRYQEALRELVERKAEGAKTVHRPTAAPRDDNVIDLMEALRRSLSGSPPDKPGRSDKPAAKRAVTPEEQAPARRKARADQKLAKRGAGEGRPAARTGGTDVQPTARRRRAAGATR